MSEFTNYLQNPHSAVQIRPAPLGIQIRLSHGTLGHDAPSASALGAFALAKQSLMTLLSLSIGSERPDTPDAVALIVELEAVLEPLYPRTSRHGLSVDQLIAQQVLFYVMRAGEAPAGCGGIKIFDGDYAEVKRMYVRPAFRGLGCGRLMLAHLAAEARARSLGRLRLETGVHQTAAIALYERFGFKRIPPFGAYQPDPLSACFEKRIE